MTERPSVRDPGPELHVGRCARYDHRQIQPRPNADFAVDNRRVITQILLSWVMTLPIAAILGATAYWVAHTRLNFP